MRRSAFFLLAAAVAAPLWAQTLAPIDDAEKTRLEAQVKAMKAEAEDIRAGAEQQFIADEKVCWQKVLVTACIDEAKARRVTVIQKARAIEVQANTLQREVNNRVLATREARRAAEAPTRAAEQQAEAERYRAEQAKAAADRQKRQQAKVQEEAAGRAQTAAEAKARAERLNAKQQDRPPRSTATPEEEVAQRVAERDKRVAEKKADREAKEKQRAAERAAWEARQKQLQGK